MARKPGRILPFRIPFFRIFYSTTYTTVYIICLGFLAITPVSMMWQAITQRALQYVVMIGAGYLLTAIVAIIIYSSRVYTSRTIMAGLGKPYVPIERDELGKNVRKMIVAQLERSAIIAWESRPRDLLGEILQAEQRGFLPAETASVDRHDYTVGREIPLDPASPPWGDIEHPGWSSPAHHDGNELPNVHYAPVIAEMPNLIEAKAVSLAPPDPNGSIADADPMVDPAVADLLRRPETMGMREYLAQLSYLGLVDASTVGQAFLKNYEHARFGGLPINDIEFKSLMAAFAELLAGMTGLSPEIIDQIRLQSGEEGVLEGQYSQSRASSQQSVVKVAASPARSPESSVLGAETAPSRASTPLLARKVSDGNAPQSATSGSQDRTEIVPPAPVRPASRASSGSEEEQSDSGSVLRHRLSMDHG